MANLIVIPAGYMGSGSSAATDIVSELEGFGENAGSYEYVFPHCPGGLFDLEDKLLIGNNALRSDEAVHTFLGTMKKLCGGGYWFSGYARRISPDFMRWCEELIGELGPYAPRGMHWYYQEDIGTFSRRVRNRLGVISERLLGKRPEKPLSYRDVTMVYPGPEEFYAAARRFMGKIFAALGYETHHLVLDQLLLPHNLFRLDHYFDENVRVLVVDRDPRDIFLINKYHWVPGGDPVPYPTEAEAFCDCYARVRRMERPADDARILRLHFEDLIYRYDESVETICAFLGARSVRKGTLFQPEVSRRNTRLFARQPAYAAEAAVIEKRLGQYLYDFPEGADEPWDASLVF